VLKNVLISSIVTYIIIFIQVIVMPDNQKVKRVSISYTSDCIAVGRFRQVIVFVK
jgi:hypothetical protein